MNAATRSAPLGVSSVDIEQRIVIHRTQPGVHRSTNSACCSRRNTRLTGRLPSLRTDTTANYCGRKLMYCCDHQQRQPRPVILSTTLSTFLSARLTRYGRRQRALHHRSSVIETRHVAQLSHFSPVTSKEITKLLVVVPSKCCSLDPLPTWIINSVADSAGLSTFV